MVVIKLFLNRMNDQIAIARKKIHKKLYDFKGIVANLEIENARNRENLEITINVYKSPVDSVLI